MLVSPINNNNLRFKGTILPSKEFNDFRKTLTLSENNILDKQINIIERVVDGRKYFYQTHIENDEKIAGLYEITKINGVEKAIPSLFVPINKSKRLFESLYKYYKIELSKQVEKNHLKRIW